MSQKLHIYTDGGSRGNPGESAIGVYITDQNELKILAFGEKIGIATNNIAEYKALLFAMQWILEQKDHFKEKELHFFMDSNLLYSQLVGLYKIKNPQLGQLLFEIHRKEKEIGLPVFYSHIPREENKQADRLVNMALDNRS